MLRFRAWFAALPVVLPDTALAVLIGLGAGLDDLLGPDARAGSAVLWDVALAAPLVLRRRATRTAAAAVGIVCLAQWLSGTVAGADLVVLVMLYTLGVREPRRWVLGLAVVVAEIGVVLAVLQWVPPANAWFTGALGTGTVTASWVLGRFVRTHRAYVASVVERARSAERDRDTQARLAVEAERARIAREMHDIVAHSLSVMITLNDAAAAVPDADEARGVIGQSSEVGRQALGEMQRLLGVLRTDVPADTTPQPRLAQLPELIAMIRSVGLAAELSLHGPLGALTPTVELTVYRIAQESLTNILKHARNVTRVTVDIAAREHGVDIAVRNDGDPSPRGDARGHGLDGMRERVGMYGGRLEAGPCPGGGWLVTARLAMPSSVTA